MCCYLMCLDLRLFRYFYWEKDKNSEEYDIFSLKCIHLMLLFNEFKTFLLRFKALICGRAKQDFLRPAETL